MQRVRSRFRHKPLAHIVLASLCATAAQLSHAQASGDLGAVQGTATSNSSGGSSSPAGPQSAPAQAPTQGSLTADAPQSIINRHYIQNSTAPTANYSDIVQIEAGGRRASFSAISLDVVLRDVVELYEPLAEYRGLSMKVHAPGPVEVIGDTTCCSGPSRTCSTMR
ncbi:MAG: iron complex outerrane recepter protein [Caballeronia sp.]|nr:iron complex outerrane recepter protein [Caballeronia sp.]